MDRWAGSDGQYDRWAETGRDYDRWAEADRNHDRWAEADRNHDRWPEDDRNHNRWPEDDRNHDRWAENDLDHDRWAENDGQFDRHDRRTGKTRSPKIKWIGLFIAWVAVTGVLLAVHLTILIWVLVVGLIGYVVYAVRRETPRAERSRRRPVPTAEPAADGREQFNAPPGWPEPPPGWTPPPGWQPNPAWPPAPPGWQFWLPPTRPSSSLRTARLRYHRGEPDDDGFTDRWR